MRIRATKCLIAVAAAAPLVLTATPAGAVVAAPRVSVAMAAPGSGIAGQYIVTLKNGASVSKEAAQNGVTTRHRFGKVLNGFSAKLSGAQLSRLRADSSVAAIEQDQVVSVATTQS